MADRLKCFLLCWSDARGSWVLCK